MLVDWVFKVFVCRPEFERVVKAPVFGVVEPIARGDVQVAP
jgi:hypothetical protein